MTEAKIPERWQEEYGLAKNEYCDALTVNLIEELGAAEQERDHFQSEWAETVRKHYECMAERDHARRDTLREAAKHVECASAASAYSDIGKIHAKWIRALADKD